MYNEPPEGFTRSALSTGPRNAEALDRLTNGTKKAAVVVRTARRIGIIDRGVLVWYGVNRPGVVGEPRTLGRYPYISRGYVIESAPENGGNFDPVTARLKSACLLSWSER